MHSTSSYDAQSKRYAIFKMPTQCRVCEKQRKRGVPLSAVVNMLNKREESGEDCTWRGGQSGPTRSMAVRKQVPHRKILPPNGWTSGAHAIVNVVNKRENYTTSG